MIERKLVIEGEGIGSPHLNVGFACYFLFHEVIDDGGDNTE